MIVAIHQPNFFPWLGYFHKMACADVFVLLDNVQLPKTGGSWANHVKVLIGGQPQWITCPILRGSGTQTIQEVRADEKQRWRTKIWRTLEQNYRKAPFWEEESSWVHELIMNPDDRLASYNDRAIAEIRDRLGIRTRLTLASALPQSDKQSTALLCAITTTLGGTSYLAGDGAAGYQEDEEFARHGLRVTHVGFQHPQYAQLGAAFQPGLSVLDAILNIGSSAAGALVGDRASLTTRQETDGGL
jgi:hypothetical protein